MTTTNTATATRTNGLTAYNALRAACKAAGLAASGTMAALQLRLAQHAGQNTDPAQGTPVAVAALNILPRVQPAQVTATDNGTVVDMVPCPVHGEVHTVDVPDTCTCNDDDCPACYAVRQQAKTGVATPAQAEAAGWARVKDNGVVVGYMPVANSVSGTMSNTPQQPIAYTVTRYNPKTRLAMPNVQRYATLQAAQEVAHSMRNASIPPTVAAVYADGALGTTTVPVASTPNLLPTTLAPVTVPVATVPVQPKAVVPVAAPVVATVPVVKPSAVQPVDAVTDNTLTEPSAEYTHSRWVLALAHMAAAIAVVEGIGGLGVRMVCKVLQRAYGAVRREERQAHAMVPTVAPVVRPAPLYAPTVTVPEVVRTVPAPVTTPQAHVATLANGTTVVRTPQGGGKVAVDVLGGAAPQAPVSQPVKATVHGTNGDTVAMAKVALEQGTLGSMGMACVALGLTFEGGRGNSMRAALEAYVSGDAMVQHNQQAAAKFMAALPPAVAEYIAPQPVAQPVVKTEPAAPIVAPLQRIGEKTNRETERKLGTLGGVFGQYSTVSVIRFLGAQGWGVKRTMAAFRGMGIDVAPATVKTQLQVGSSGIGGGPVADISQEQYNTLQLAANGATVAR